MSPVQDFGAMPHYAPSAGPWVAYEDATLNGRPMRSYVQGGPFRNGSANDPEYGKPYWGFTTHQADALRFPTRLQALACVRARGRRAGVRTGAERVG